MKYKLFKHCSGTPKTVSKCLGGVGNYGFFLCDFPCAEKMGKNEMLLTLPGNSEL
jgi:hypothetical protein